MIPVPQMVGPDVISTRYEVVAATQAPDGLMVFTRVTPGTLNTRTVLCQSMMRHGRYGAPSVLPFSGMRSDIAPQFSADGKRLFFVSRRGKEPLVSVWYADRVGTMWGVAKKLPTPTLDKVHQTSFSESASHNAIEVTFEGGRTVLSYLKRASEGYEKPVPIEAISKLGYVADACIAPDESCIVASVIGASDEVLVPGAIYQRGDLYISYRKNGEWQAPVHLSKAINTGAGENAPSISGGYLYFASDRGWLKPRKRALTYAEVQREIRTNQNCLSKVYRVRLKDILRR